MSEGMISVGNGYGIAYTNALPIEKTSEHPQKENASTIEQSVMTGLNNQEPENIHAILEKLSSTGVVFVKPKQPELN